MDDDYDVDSEMDEFDDERDAYEAGYHTGFGAGGRVEWIGFVQIVVDRWGNLILCVDREG